MRGLNILGNLSNFGGNNNNIITDLFFLSLYILDEYLESVTTEEDKKQLREYSNKLNKAIQTNDFSEITEDFINGLNEMINNIGEN